MLPRRLQLALQVLSFYMSNGTGSVRDCSDTIQENFRGVQKVVTALAHKHFLWVQPGVNGVRVNREKVNRASLLELCTALKVRYTLKEVKRPYGIELETVITRVKWALKDTSVRQALIGELL